MAYRIRYTGGRYIRKKKRAGISYVAGIVACAVLMIHFLSNGWGRGTDFDFSGIRTSVVESCRQILIEAGYHGQDYR